MGEGTRESAKNGHSLVYYNEGATCNGFAYGFNKKCIIPKC